MPQAYEKNGSGKKKGKKKGSKTALIIAGAALVAGIFVMTRTAAAAPGKNGIPKGKGPGGTPPPNAPPSARPAPELTEAPVPVPSGGIIDDAPGPTTSKAPGSDPLEAAGWNWEFIGAVDPESPWSVGQVLSADQLPFGADAVLQSTPLDTVEVAYYLAQQEMLAPGYYVVGQINEPGYTWEPPFWGIVQIWQGAY